MKKRGRPPTNLLPIIKNDLESVNIKSNLNNPETFQEVETMCSDRDQSRARCSIAAAAAAGEDEGEDKGGGNDYFSVTN